MPTKVRRDSIPGTVWRNFITKVEQGESITKAQTLVGIHPPLVYSQSVERRAEMDAAKEVGKQAKLNGRAKVASSVSNGKIISKQEFRGVDLSMYSMEDRVILRIAENGEQKFYEFLSMREVGLEELLTLILG